MDTHNFLVTISQIGLALAGFAGLVGVFRGTDEGLTPTEMAGVRLMIEHSFAASLLALVPLLLAEAPMPDRAIWQTSSLLLALFLAIETIIQHSRVKSLIECGTPPRRLAQFRSQFYPITTLMLLVQLLNVFSHRSAFAFLLGLLWLLIAPAIQFYHFVLGPPQPKKP